MPLRCVCGFSTFRVERSDEQVQIQRWMRFVSGGGFGAFPAGLLFGSGGGPSSWGEFEGTLYRTTVKQYCRSCGRFRSAKVLGSFAPFGAWVSGNTIFLAMANFGLLGSAMLEVRGFGRTYQVPLSRELIAIPPLETGTAPIHVADTPQGPTVDSVLSGRFPEVARSGSYTVWLVWTGLGGTTEIELTSIYIEEIMSNIQVLDPGLPAEWITEVPVTPVQAGTGATHGIPFEWCQEALEYDARFGTLPSAQGWTHGGAGSPLDYTLDAAGALRMSTSAISNWGRTVTPSAAFTIAQYNSSARYRIISNSGASGGLVMSSDLVRPGGSHSMLVRRFMDNDVDIAVSAGGAPSNPTSVAHRDDRGWTETAWTADTDNDEYYLIHKRMLALTGAMTAAGGAADLMGSLFGSLTADPVDALIQYVRVSTPGRFARSWFTGFAPTSDPMLRLYMWADSPPTADRLARFTIRYGTNLSNPHEIPSSTIEVDYNFAVANNVYEIPIQLTGVSAGPLTFTVERSVGHANDRMRSTAWLKQGTVRSV